MHQIKVECIPLTCRTNFDRHPKAWWFLWRSSFLAFFLVIGSTILLLFVNDGGIVYVARRRRRDYGLSVSMGRWELEWWTTAEVWCERASWEKKRTWSKGVYLCPQNTRGESIWDLITRCAAKTKVWSESYLTSKGRRISISELSGKYVTRNIITSTTSYFL